MIKGKMSIVKGIVLVSIAAFIVFLIIEIIKVIYDHQRARAQKLPSVYSLSSEDSSVIARKYWDQIKVNEVLLNKERNPISLMTVDQNYSLIMYKLDLINNAPLSQVLNEEIKNEDRSIGYTYTVIDNNFFRFHYKAGATYPVSEIYLSLAGDSLQKVFTSDRIVSYYLLAKNVSIRYSKSDPIDLNIEAETKGFKTNLVPMNILVLKRKDKFYLLFIAPNNTKGSISHKFLYNLVATP